MSKSGLREIVLKKVEQGQGVVVEQKKGLQAVIPTEEISEWFDEKVRLGSKAFSRIRAKFEEGMELAQQYLEDKSEEVKHLYKLPRLIKQEKVEEEKTEDANRVFPIRVTQKKYKLGRDPIGIGGFSTVWPATMAKRLHSLLLPESRYELAIKICELGRDNIDAAKKQAMEDLDGDFSLSEGGDQQVSELSELETEVTILKKLLKQKNHAHVVELVDYFMYTPMQQVFLVMKRYPTTLEEPARTRMFEIPHLQLAKLVVMRQLVDALLFLQNNNIIHADLKHSNIMVSRMGILRLGDFGLAREVKPGQKSVKVDTVKGSPEYMAPETLTKGLSLSYSADVWSLGICIFALYNLGKTMFDQYSSLEMCYFGEDYWEAYRESDWKYYNNFLGTRYLTPQERESTRSKGRKPNAALERAYRKGRDKIIDVADIVRGALLPTPEDAKRHNVKREVGDRITLEQISDDVEALLIKNKLPSKTHEARQRSLIIQVLKRYETEIQ